MAAARLRHQSRNVSGTRALGEHSELRDGEDDGVGR